MKAPNTKVFEVHRLNVCEMINEIRMIGIFKRNPMEPVPNAVDRLLQMLQLPRCIKSDLCEHGNKAYHFSVLLIPQARGIRSEKLVQDGYSFFVIIVQIHYTEAVEKGAGQCDGELVQIW